MGGRRQRDTKTWPIAYIIRTLPLGIIIFEHTGVTWGMATHAILSLQSNIYRFDLELVIDEYTYV